LNNSLLPPRILEISPMILDILVLDISDNKYKKKKYESHGGG